MPFYELSITSAVSSSERCPIYLNKMCSSEYLSYSCRKRSSYLSSSVTLLIRPIYTLLTTPWCLELAVLVDDPTAHRQPSRSNLERWNAERISSVKAQLAATEVKEAQQRDDSRTRSEEAVRKRKEREAKRAAAARAKAIADGMDPDSLPTEDATSPPTTVSTKEERPSTPFANAVGNSGAVYTVTVPAESTELEWYSPEQATYSTLQDAKAAEIWTYPSTLHERAKCAVFQDLWRKDISWAVVSNLAVTSLFILVRLCWLQREND